MDGPENADPIAPLKSEEDDALTEQEARAVFDAIDVNQSGDLDLDEVVGALTLLGVPQPREGAETLFRAADDNKDGVLSFDEFKGFLTKKAVRLRSLFDELDLDEDGLLSAKEVASGIEKLYQVRLEPAAVSILLQRVDKNGDDQVSFQEWFRFLMLLPLDDNEDLHANARRAFDFWTETAHVDLGMSHSVFKHLPAETGLTPAQTMIAAGMSGTASSTATAPLDRLRMLIQVEGRNFAPNLYQGFRKLLGDNGVKGLWRGNLLSVAKNLPESGIFWIAYESMRKLVAERTGKRKSALTKSENFLCGSVAGSTGFVILYPFDVVRTRYSVVARSNDASSSLKSIVAKTYNAHGFRGFYGGLWPGLLGSVPYAGTRLAAYETIKSNYLTKLTTTPDGQPAPLNRWAPLAAGAVSSMCGQLVSFPLYSLSVKMQTQSGKNSFHVAKSLVKADGFRGLYRGLAVSLMKVAPSSSISFLVYEEAKRVMLAPGA